MPRHGDCRHVAVAITGASGSIYALRLVQQLMGAGLQVSLLLSSAGRLVLNQEQGLEWSEQTADWQQQAQDYFAVSGQQLHCFAEQDFMAPLASGSAAADALVIVPASMGSVARVANGISGNLIERVADVMLKERRLLIIVPRETPFNTIHLHNLLTLAQSGAVILPAMPAFYTRPQTMDDLINFVVGKILDSLGLAHALFRRWGENHE